MTVDAEDVEVERLVPVSLARDAAVLVALVVTVLGPDLLGGRDSSPTLEIVAAAFEDDDGNEERGAWSTMAGVGSDGVDGCAFVGEGDAGRGWPREPSREGCVVVGVSKAAPRAGFGGIVAGELTLRPAAKANESRARDGDAEVRGEWPSSPRA